MAIRHPFGGDIASFVVQAGTANAAILQTGVTVTFFTAATGGTAITDLSLDSVGASPITSVLSSDGSTSGAGWLPPFYGPVGTTAMWAQAGTSAPRVLITSTDAATVATSVADNLVAHIALRNPHTTRATDLADVAVTSPVNGQMLAWSSSASKFTNQTVPSSGGGGGGSAVDVIVWTPSDQTGATDMTAELEAFRAAHLGRVIRVADGSKIQLKNCFGSVTTGDILLDLTGVTVLYDANTSGDWALRCDNVANASAEVAVSSLALTVVNTDATVSQLTLASTLAAKRFDWIALYSQNANPAIAGTGYYGEIVQLLRDEASLVLTATRQLNRHTAYSTGVYARKLDSNRKVRITGGTFTARTDPENHAVTNRCTAVLVRGFVDPEVVGVTFDAPWDAAVQFVACAAPKTRDIAVRDIGDLGTYGGFTYGVVLYGMNDSADIRDTVVRNGRHAAFTTDGDKSGSTTWYKKGIPTNGLVDGVHATNCHGAPIDTHEAGDRITFTNIHVENAYQDDDINPNFSSRGMGIQIRCANVTIRGYTVNRGAAGIRINAINHGFRDRIQISDVIVRDLTDPGSAAGTDTDVAIRIYDQAALANKRDVFVDNLIVDNAGTAIICGTGATLTLGTVTARRCAVFLDAAAGSAVTGTGALTLDYRNSTRTAPFYAVRVRSDSPNGGARVVMMQAPRIIKGSVATPVAFFDQADTTASKKIYAPSLVEDNPSTVTATVYSTAGATTFTQVAVTGAGTGSLAGLSDVASSSPSNGQVLVYNSSTGKYTNTTLTGSAVAAAQIVTGVSGTYNIDWALSRDWDITSTNDVTLTMSNFPASGTPGELRMVFHQGGSGSNTIVWPTYCAWDNGTEPTQSTAVGATDAYTFYTVNGGTTLFCDQVGQGKAAAGGGGSGGGGGTGLPASILDLSKWKIDLPIDDSGGTSGKAKTVTQPALATFTHPTWYFVNAAGDGVVFVANAGGATTSSNTGYARSEYREMTGSDGKTQISFGSNDGSTHTLIITQAVMELPVAKPQVACGQIHDANNDIIEILADGYRPTSGTVATTGTDTVPFSIMYRFNGTTDNSTPLLTGYTLGTKFTVKIVVAGGQILLYANTGTSATMLKKTITSGIPGADASANLYFKAGCYVQSNTSNSGKTVPSGSCAGGANLTDPVAGASAGGDAANAKGVVTIYALSHTHV